MIRQLKIDDSFAAGQIVEYQQVICFLFFSVRIEAFVVEKRTDSLRATERFSPRNELNILKRQQLS